MLGEKPGKTQNYVTTSLHYLNLHGNFGKNSQEYKNKGKLNHNYKNLFFNYNYMSTNINCDSCDSCDYCDYCDYCNFCNFCDYCNFCDSCTSCFFCKNLRMTEYNLFCYSEEYNDENSYQQKKYRVFNVEVGEERYNQVKNNLPTFVLKLQEKDWKDAWLEAWENTEVRDYITTIPEFTWEFWTEFSGIQK